VKKTKASSRVHEIIDAAQRLFGQRGYRRTQIADVARQLDLSSGIVYHYFESKEALFHTALEQALRPDAAVTWDGRPIPTPEPGATLAMVRAHVEQWVAAPLIDAALTRKRAADPRAELEELVGSFFDGAQARRCAADLLERSAMDLPDLANLWFGEIRRGHFERLTRYLQQRMDEGQLRSLPDAGIAARIIIEIVVFFARHRHRDPYEKLDDDAVRENILGFVLAALEP
jgi:AcrR family transcriptional regulator